MAKQPNKSTADKISDPFRKRLRRLGPNDKIHALVLLRTSHLGSGRRQSITERKAAIEAIQNEAATAMEEIDRILGQHDGKRLDDVPNALGCIAIETTAGGVLAVTQSDCVKAVLEDQPISPL
jgi:hypothetical protein